jgi:hypothetical protein
VNPRNECKERWLDINGKLLGSIGYKKNDYVPAWTDFASDCLPVVLVDNGPFRAAGVTYCKKEYECFIDQKDDRPRLIYEVPIAKLMDDSVSDLKDFEKYIEAPPVKTIVDGKRKINL